MQNDLKPCPKCQSTQVHLMVGVLEDRGFSILCGSCGIRQSSAGYTKEQAIAAWNQRTTPTTDSTDLEARLRDFLTRATPDWVIYSEPDVGLPPSLFAGTPGQTGFRPLEPLEGYDLNLAVEAVNAVPSLLDTLASQRAEATQLRDKLARAREELNALQDAERTYRQEHDLHGEGSWEANYAWDVMRRKGDAARQALKDTQP